MSIREIRPDLYFGGEAAHGNVLIVASGCYSMHKCRGAAPGVKQERFIIKTLKITKPGIVWLHPGVADA